MKVLITSGTGKVGKAVTQLLLQRGHVPVVMSHSKEKMAQMPDKVEAVFGDFSLPQTWANIFSGVQKLCMITPTIENEASVGCAFIEAAVAAGIQQVVLLSIHNSEAGAHLPHFQAKLAMEKVLKESKIPYTFIRPNNFFQNDQFFLEEIKEQKMYLQPIGPIGLSRVDVRDIAQAMVNALLDSRHQFRSYPIVGPEVITGEKAAKIYSDVMGERITYPKNCLELWEKKFKSSAPAWLMSEWKPMYEMFIKQGLVASEDDYILMSQILDNPARTYENYVKELIGEAELSEGEILSP